MKTHEPKIIFRSVLMTAVFAVGVLMCSRAGANTQSDFPQQYSVAGVNLNLQGTGVKRVLLFRAFKAGLYLNASEHKNDPLDNVPKRIEVEYYVDVPGKKLSDFTVESMLENITEKEFSRINEEVEEMRKYFVDLKPGDRYSLTYIPGEGTFFLYNGRLKGTIKGEAFARALFSVWLGKKPFDPEIKEKILLTEKKA